jgi:hypothetical protein
MPAVVWSDNNRVDGGAKTGVGYARQVGGLSAFAPAVTTPPAKARTAPVPPRHSTGPSAAPSTGRLPATGLSTTLPLLALAALVLAMGLRRRAG